MANKEESLVCPFQKLSCIILKLIEIQTRIGTQALFGKANNVSTIKMFLNSEVFLVDRRLPHRGKLIEKPSHGMYHYKE